MSSITPLAKIFVIGTAVINTHTMALPRRKRRRRRRRRTKWERAQGTTLPAHLRRAV